MNEAGKNRRQTASPTGNFGYPVAHPIASSHGASSSLVNAENRQLGLTNDGAHRGTTHSDGRHRRITARDIAKIASRLSERDMAIVRSVAEHQFLTPRHVQALHFADHAPISGSRIARRVLARLRELRLLGTLDRRIGGVYAGSHGLVYYVDVVGDRLLSGRTGRGARRPHEPTERFLRHRLAIADANVDLITADRAGDLELVDSAVEPASWRTFTGVGAARQILKSDLYAETATTDDLVCAWFIEVDRGTESIPTLLTKCREYEAYRQTGIEQDRHGAFPLVIWSMTDPNAAKAARRRSALTEAIAADRTLPSALFRIVAPDQLVLLIQNGGAL